MPDGLAVMVQGYYSMGLYDLSDQALVILKANYPTYPYLDKDGNFEYQTDLQNEKRSWLNIATAGLLGKSEQAGFDTRALYAKEAKNYDGSSD